MEASSEVRTEAGGLEERVPREGEKRRTRRANLTQKSENTLDFLGDKEFPVLPCAAPWLSRNLLDLVSPKCLCITCPNERARWDRWVSFFPFIKEISLRLVLQKRRRMKKEGALFYTWKLSPSRAIAMY